MITAKFVGLASVASQLSDVVKVVKIAVAVRNADVAEKLAEAMRARVPVESGHLRDSIRVERNENGTITVRAGGEGTTKDYARGTVYNSQVKIGEGDTQGRRRVDYGYSVSYDYALAIEYGTLSVSPEPFFWSTVEEFRQQYGEEIFAAADEVAGGA